MNKILKKLAIGAVAISLTQFANAVSSIYYAGDSNVRSCSLSTVGPSTCFDLGTPIDPHNLVRKLSISNGTLYAISAIPGVTDVYKYVGGKAWATIGKIPYSDPIQYSSAFDTLNGSLYVGAGAAAFSQTPAAVYRYDATSNTWSRVGNTNIGLSTVTALTADSQNNIYAAGTKLESTESGMTFSVHVFKYDGSSWTEVGSALPPMTLVPSLAIFNNELYLAGSGLFKYSNLQGWITIPDSNIIRSATSLTVIDNKLYIAGARTVYVYDGRNITQVGNNTVGDGVLSNIIPGIFKGTFFVGGYDGSSRSGALYQLNNQNNWVAGALPGTNGIGGIVSIVYQ